MPFTGFFLVDILVKKKKNLLCVQVKTFLSYEKILSRKYHFTNQPILFKYHINTSK